MTQKNRYMQIITLIDAYGHQRNGPSTTVSVSSRTERSVSRGVRIQRKDENIRFRAFSGSLGNG